MFNAESFKNFDPSMLQGSGGSIKSKLIGLVILIVIVGIIYLSFRENFVSFAKVASDLGKRQDIYHGEQRHTNSENGYKAGQEWRESVAYIDNAIEDDIEKAQL